MDRSLHGKFEPALALIARWIELPWLDRRCARFYAGALLAASLTAIVIWSVRTIAQDMIDPLGRAIGCDFVAFWTAAHAAIGHQAAAIYDFPTFQTIENSAVGVIKPEFPWHYPPTLLLPLLPLGALPYLWALPIWLGAGIAAYVWLARRIVGEDGTLVLIGVAFPGVILTFAYGQMGMLLTAVLGWSLLLLDERPAIAGLLIGLLSIKPHLFLLLPLALLVSRRWQALGWAAGTVLLLVAASWLAFGTDTWQGFLADGGFMRRLYEGHFMPWYRVPSAFVLTRLLGASMVAAYAAQCAFAAAGILAVVWSWRTAAPLQLQLAAVVVAGLTVSPYLFDYDLILLILPIAWLAEAAMARGWLAGEKLVLLVAWLSPALVAPIAAVLKLQVGPLVIGALLWAVCRRIAYERRESMPAALPQLLRHIETTDLPSL